MDASPPKWVTLGHPSYVWRFGQDRRLAMVRAVVPLEGRRILDVGCGIGTYVRKFREFSDEVYGVDIDPERVAEASRTLPNIQVAPAEDLPFPDDFFDVVFLHEVIEHVQDDRLAIREATRVTRPNGAIVIFAPNRLYPFETHGIYLGQHFLFGNIPLVNYLPDRWRNRLCPHVRAYTAGQLRRLFTGLPVTIIVHRCIYPGFDKIAARRPWLARILRAVLYTLEQTPAQALGLSHFLVARKVAPRPEASAMEPTERRTVGS